jgi:dihydropteroate synthase
MRLMGVLNATPDSFYEKGAYFSFEKAFEHGIKLWKDGADYLDIGGASSRPFAPFVDEEEELRRVIPLIEVLSKEISIPISIDTDKPKVAHKAVEKGARLINSIEGFTHPEMVEVAASCTADLCVMHMQGTPQTMQLNPSYPEGVISHLLAFFEKQIERLNKAGIHSNRIILDPGIGFGKTVEQNLTIIKELQQFKKFGLRILLGASRKSFMGKLLGKSTTELLPATLTIHTIVLLNGIDIVRVHDVREHRDAVDILRHLTTLSG